MWLLTRTLDGGISAAEECIDLMSIYLVDQHSMQTISDEVCIHTFTRPPSEVGQARLVTLRPRFLPPVRCVVVPQNPFKKERREFIHLKMVMI